MTDPTINYGSVRQVWFAKVAAPTTKWSFLVRDDAGSKTGALYGRTVRLGDPVTLGPNSVWQQRTWEGGLDQERWRDSAMYKAGNADTATNLGRAQLPVGWKAIITEKKRGVTDYIMHAGSSDVAATAELLIAESNYEPARTDPTTSTTTPPTGFRIYSYNPTTDVLSTVKNDLTQVPTNIVPVVDSTYGVDYAYVVIATTEAGYNQFLYVYDNTTPTYSYTETPYSSGWVYANSAVAYNEFIYWGASRKNASWGFPGGSIWRRHFDGVTGGYNVVKQLPHFSAVRAFTVWNNRIWFAGILGSANAVIMTTDGVTTVPAFELSSGLIPRKLVSALGNLYIVGYRNGAKATDGVIGEVWKYNGSSLTRIWQKGTGVDGQDWGVYDACAWDKYLVWTVNGNTPSTDTPGLYFYDPELDAISSGPSMGMHASSASYKIRNVINYNNRLAFSVWDTKNYASTVNQPTVVAITKGDGAVRPTITAASLEGYSVESQPATLERYVLSSIYQGEPGTEAEQKVWLTGRARTKIPAADGQILIQAIVDETTYYTVATINYDAAHTGWVDTVFPLKASGDYLVGNSIQYRVLLRNTASSADSTSNPVIDQISDEYMVKPKKRRQWLIRCLLSDKQDRIPEGDVAEANSLTTIESMASKLEELWSEQKPVLYWEADATGADPTGSGIEVNVTQWNEQRFRLTSDHTEVGGEVGLTLVEVVTS